MLRMKVNRFVTSLAVLAALLCLPAFAGAKKNLADYPLRLHIYQTNWSRNGFGYHGFGRANLFDEKGQPHGVEYTYDCDLHLMASNGPEAYPARWKKAGQSMEVIFGEIGQKPDEFHTCDFKIAQKSYVFYRGSAGLDTESPDEFMAHPGNQAPMKTLTADDVPRSANER